jgi:protein-tyrosine sulfotransferase
MGRLARNQLRRNAMVKHDRVVRVLCFELSLLDVIWRSRSCLPSRIALAIGLMYWISPWQLIPDRIPIFGYFDQLLIGSISLISARLLVPSRIEHRIVRQWGLADHLDNDCPVCRSMICALSIRSDLIINWLVFKRRALRSSLHFIKFCRGIRSRWVAVTNRRRPSEILFAFLGYRLWWLLRCPFAAGRSDLRSIVVIGGAPRSGTTLLRTLLGRHPMLASGPETTVFLRRISSPATVGERLGLNSVQIEQWQRETRSQTEFIERVHRSILERSGKAIWVEKTPKNVGRFNFVRRRFPQAKLVHIIRDGRDVVCSLRRTPFAKLDHLPWESFQAAQRCAVQWRSSVRAGLRFRDDPLYYELRYEDLVRDPASTLRDLTNFLGVPWVDCILHPATEEMSDSRIHPMQEPNKAIIPTAEILGTSVGRWHHELTHNDCKALRLLISTLLVKLGYENRLDWSSGLGGLLRD